MEKLFFRFAFCEGTGKDFFNSIKTAADKINTKNNIEMLFSVTSDSDWPFLIVMCDKSDLETLDKAIVAISYWDRLGEIEDANMIEKSTVENIFNNKNYTIALNKKFK